MVNCPYDKSVGPCNFAVDTYRCGNCDKKVIHNLQIANERLETEFFQERAYNAWIIREIEEIIKSFDELLGAIDEPQCGKIMVKSHIEGEYKKLCKIVQKWSN